MKKAFCIILGMLLLLSLSACRQKNEKEIQTAPEKELAENIEVSPNSSYSPKVGNTSNWCWTGVAQSGNIYELQINQDNTFCLFYHDVSICEGLGEDNVTWRSGGAVESTDDELTFTTAVDGAEFVSKYKFSMEREMLFLEKTEGERLFSDLELEAENSPVIFKKDVFKVAIMASAFAICDVYDQKEAYEKYFWEIMQTALNMYLPEEEFYTESEIMLCAGALFGDYYKNELPPLSKSDITFNGSEYTVPFSEKVIGYIADTVEPVEDGFIIYVQKDKSEPVYIQVSVERDSTSIGFGYRIKSVEKL